MTLLLSLTLLVGLPGTAPANALTLRTRLLHIINHTRETHGLHPLKLNPALSDDARRHTLRMIRYDRLFHSPDLPDVLRPWKWSAWGENVGCSTSLAKLHAAFMASPTHRHNILNPKFRKVGLGVVRYQGHTICGSVPTVWATEIFYG